MPGHALQRRQLHTTHLFKQVAGHLLEDIEHILLVGKGHLTVYLCKLRLAVSTQVLVAEALGNLEITVEARDHQQLLQRLGTLRQGIELAWIHSRWHHEVAGSLGR